jgi:hypothetical protein
MPVKMQPTSVIKANLGIELNGKVQKFFTNTCYRYMDKYVPKDNGILRENVTIDSNSITYEQKYAHAQYIGEVNGRTVVNYTTPGTGPYWDKRMVSAEMQDIVKEVQDYVNRGGK